MPLDRSRPILSRRVVVAGDPPAGAYLGDWTRVREYARRVNASIDALNADARAQIVYADPGLIAEIAKDYGEGVPGSVVELAERAKVRGATQTAKDLQWAARWNELVVTWKDWLDDVDSVSPGVTPWIAWERTQGYEARLRDLHQQFGALGGTKPTAKLPETLETGTGKPEEKSGIPWSGILGVGGLMAAAWALSSVSRIVGR